MNYVSQCWHRDPTNCAETYNNWAGATVYNMCERGIVLRGPVASTIAGMTVSEGKQTGLNEFFPPFYTKCVLHEMECIKVC